ncbi:MAG: hypothetical protein AB9900_10885 [Humidesulfovibrio sp.]
MLPRQRRLRVWLLERPEPLDLKALAESCNISTSGLHNEFYQRETMKADVHAACLALGIPLDLLPPPTRPKAELLRENQELRERLAKYEPQALAS